jgi:23S rRNA (cytosine1962-C5)-methyltransferase
MLLDFIVDDFSIVEERGHRVLNLFSYTGGFGVAALRGGFGLPGYVVNVDSSREVLELAEANFKLNFGEGTKSVWKERDYTKHVEFIQADVFDYLHDIAEQGEQFDVVICDPPKFAQNAQQVERAARGYKDLNLNCFKIIKPGGYLMTFSCSGAVSADLFQKIVFGALADSGRQAQILRHLGPSDDHPVALTFPEGAYLKGLLLRVY